jgi:hypothetical protein
MYYQQKLHEIASYGRNGIDDVARLGAGADVESAWP